MLICIGALQYTTLVFGSPGLCTLKQYMRDKGMTNMYMTIYYNYISLLLQYHITCIITHLSE